MKFCLSVTLLVLVSCSELIAQKEANVWYFGYKAGLDFSCSPPKPITGSMYAPEGSATISSPAGELRFYTDGSTVWNKTHQVMENGADIGGNCTGFGNQSSSSQSAIIVPHPGDKNLYYIFTTDCHEDDYANGFRYSIVDVSLNQGLGAVTVKDVLLFASTTEKIAAVHHSDEKSIWVVGHQLNDNVFNAYLINSSGLNTTPVVSATGQIHTTGRCYMKFSPDGKQLITLFYTYLDNKSPELFSFDASTGSLSSKFVLPFAETERYYYSASFSLSGKVLYLGATSWYGGIRLHQFNLQAGSPSDIVNSRYLVDDNSYYDHLSGMGFPFGALQMGPDGKIYIPNYNPSFNTETSFYNTISVIHDPDNIYNYNYQRGAIKTNCGSYAYWGMPNFIESYFREPLTLPSCPSPLSFKANFTYTENLCKKTVDFTSSLMPSTDVFSLSWNFADPDAGEQNTSTLSEPSHTFTKPGDYLVTLTVMTAFDCQPYIVTKQVHIPKLPSLSQDTALCVGSKLLLNIEVKDGIYSWQDGSTKPTYEVAQAGIYWVDVTVNTCTYRDSIQVMYESPPQVHLGGIVTFCQGESVVLNATTTKAQYHWQDGEQKATYTAKSPGLYWVDVTLGSCTIRDSVEVIEQLPPTLSLGGDTTLCSDETLVLSAYHPGAAYLWNDGSSNASLTIQAPGRYWVSITQGACRATDTISINYQDCIRFIPNVITPNGDGSNDQFIVQGIGYQEWHLLIFNRWGKQIASIQNYKNDWAADGLESGIYYYYLSNSATKQRYKGNVHVLK